jgi:hypothetical protein
MIVMVVMMIVMMMMTIHRSKPFCVTLKVITSVLQIAYQRIFT